MSLSLTTDRLKIDLLQESDHEFMQALVNSPGWLQFIGQRNVSNTEEAIAYIQKIRNNPNTDYWVVRKKESSVPVGIVTLIKRDYLDHHDIGFAFLPAFTNQGFAFEATKIFIEHLSKEHTIFQATTVPENIKSIQLLKKLGFQFEKTITRDKENLSVFKISF